MSVSRIQLIGVYLAARLVVSLFAFVALSQVWVRLATGAWPATGYLLVAALVPCSELLVVPLLVAVGGAASGGKWRLTRRKG